MQFNQSQRLEEDSARNLACSGHAYVNQSESSNHALLVTKSANVIKKISPSFQQIRIE